MAPCPEEIDVFSVPHSRMKELVCQYLDMLTATNFSDVSKFIRLLENLIKTFHEFIAHEQIENQFIMKKLKHKLQALRIQNTAVCNCHKDNKLTDMLSLLQDGYKCTKKTDDDRRNFGLQLKQALQDFTEEFLPHMAEEEEVFQPLLMQHFTFDELKQIKATVLQQHFKVEPEEAQEKCVADNKSNKNENQSKSVSTPTKTCHSAVSLDQLPDEVILEVFSFLNPRDLLRCAQVNRRWNNLAMDSTLWMELYPVSWAQGNWSAQQGVYEEDFQDVEKKLETKAFDEDADVDEAEDWDLEAIEIQKQSKMLTSMCKHLLPRVGRSVRVCDLAYSKGLTNGTLYKILTLCPNLERLDLTQTRVSDLGFKGFNKNGCGKCLRYLDLSGCLYITDLTLQRLSAAIGQNPSHMNDNSALIGQLTSSNENRHFDDQDVKNNNNSCAQFPEKYQSCMNCVKNQLYCKQVGKKDSLEKKGFLKTQLNERFEGRQDCTHTRPSVSGEPCGSVDVEQQGPCTRVLRADCDKNCCCGNQKETATVVSHYNEQYQPCNSGSCVMPKVSDIVVIDKNDDSGGRVTTRELDDIQTLEESLDGPDGWKGSTVENLVMLDDDMQDTMITIKPVYQTESFELNQTADRTLSKSDFLDERTPTDYIPGQTTFPDYILHHGNDHSDDELENKSSRPFPVKEYRVLDSVWNDGDTQTQKTGRMLEFLSLSGCYQITDEGLNALTFGGGLPHLTYLDLSGCLNAGGGAVSDLVDSAPKLNPAHLFYCDNIEDGPYPDKASGCRNLQCGSRVCCRCAE